jgi:hypothetical protein
MSRTPLSSQQKEIYITERHIQAIWLEQKFLGKLETSEGEEINVISPGIWNLGPGPDFHKAHIVIGGVDYHGSVELHLSEESWYHHHHHKDTHYNDVVLHVSLWKPARAQAIWTEEGRRLSQMHLESFLTIPIAKLAQAIDLDLYPYKQFVGAGRCAEGLFRNMTEVDATGLFESAANWRLQRKAAYLNSRSATPAEQLMVGIAMAAGYKNNGQLFLNLLSELKRRDLDREDERLAWLLGKTGFFGEPWQDRWGKSTYYVKLSGMWKFLGEGEEIIRPLLTQIRPMNHPVRRLPILAKMLGDNSLAFLLGSVIDLWENSWREAMRSKKWSRFLKSLEDLLPNYSDDYWNRHYLFEDTPSQKLLPLIGGDLKRKISINVIFPLLEQYLTTREDEEIQAFKHCFRSLPSSEAGKSKYLVHRFFGDSTSGVLLDKAYNVQGAYQIHYDYCIHYEASCEGCPFMQEHQMAYSWKPGTGRENYDY